MIDLGLVCKSSLIQIQGENINFDIKAKSKGYECT